MWTEHISNPESLKSVFGSIPDLSELEIMEIILNQQGELFHIRCNVEPFPRNVPEKWKEYNMLQLTLSFGPVKNLKITNWEYPVKGVFIASMNEQKKIDFRFESTGCICEGQCEFILIEKISAYADERR